MPKKTQAQRADKYDLYERSVQDAEPELDFVVQAFDEVRGRQPVTLREDFCGAAWVASEWVRRGAEHRAIGVDIDDTVLAWGQERHIAPLSAEQRSRIELIKENVLSVNTKADALLAMNFSYYLFKTRQDLRRYFEHARECLKEGGLMIMDVFGGYDAFRELEEPREMDGFTYVWDQDDYNPVTGHIRCYIHFEFDDDSRIDRAFTYEWRMWTLPELRELLAEAGFSRTHVYWEGTDENDEEEGNGVYERTEVGDADPGWVSYLVAER